MLRNESFWNGHVYPEHDLGAVCSRDKTIWKLWAPLAKSAELVLYRTGSDAEKEAGVLGSYAMVRGSFGEWQLMLEGDYHGVYYTYRLVFPDHCIESHDPYARAAGVNGARSMAVDLSRTDPEGWESDRTVFCPHLTDAIIWETHVGDFSVSPDGRMKNRGKFLAFCEETGNDPYPTGIGYLRQLGITHVQLMPVFDFITVDERIDGESNYNWGYDPWNYNVPEGSYSTDPYHGEVRIREMKQMIQALHAAGIGVVMDVVYNHTFDLVTSAFDRCVPGYYYRTTEQGMRADGSACGNELATERPMVRSYILDSLRYWAEEYHIDGFRLDLMGCLDVETVNQIRMMLDTLPNGESRLLYGEPWSALPVSMDRPSVHPADQAHLQELLPRIGFFCAETRNAIKGDAFTLHERGFASGGKNMELPVRNALCAWCGPDLAYPVPEGTVQFVSVHDNRTLWDQLLLSRHGSEEAYDHPDLMLMACNKLAAAMILMAQGTPFFLSGEEFGRTKYGNENSYRSGFAVNALSWERSRSFGELTAYYKGLIAIRRAFSALRDPSVRSVRLMGFSPFQEQVAAFTLPGRAGDRWSMLACIFNASDEEKQVRLASWSDHPLPEEWQLLANENHASAEGLGVLRGNMFHIPPRAVYVLGADQT